MKCQKDTTYAIFLKSWWLKDVKNDIPKCSIYKYRNTNTNTNTPNTNAPFNDLQSIVHFRKLRAFMPAVANEALATWERHLDYLTPELVVLGLACEKMPVDQKNAIARELLSLLPNRPVDLPPSRVTYPGPNFANGDNFFSAEDAFPDLGGFITLSSFLIFNILQTPNELMVPWLSSPADTWSYDPNSPNFHNAFFQLHLFAKNCHWTNDAAER